MMSVWYTVTIDWCLSAVGTTSNTHLTEQRNKKKPPQKKEKKSEQLGHTLAPVCENKIKTGTELVLNAANITSQQLRGKDILNEKLF